MKAADFDQKNCDKEYSKQLQQQAKEKYEALIAKADEQEKPKLMAEYKDAMRKAKNTKLVTQIQMIFQDPIASLDPRMTVKEIIGEGLVIQGETNKKVLDEKVFEMLEQVGLVREHASRYPHEFSGGQRQRIGVARSVIMNPELIIADEPVSALDVSVQAQVINLLNELREKLGLTILFIAHDLSVVKYFSDRIGVMYFGKMVELASSDELFKHPLHPYTRSLLSAIPLPDPEYEKTRQRISYNPLAAHDYTVDKPSFREISPGHFVMCNDAEEAEYRKLVEETK
jgi:oligopeptide transport system ATP-binding protein